MAQQSPNFRSPSLSSSYQTTRGRRGGQELQVGNDPSEAAAPTRPRLRGEIVFTSSPPDLEPPVTPASGGQMLLMCGTGLFVWEELRRSTVVTQEHRNSSLKPFVKTSLKPPEVQTGRRTEPYRLVRGLYQPGWPVQSLISPCGPAAGTTGLKTPRKSLKR